MGRWLGHRFLLWLFLIRFSEGSGTSPLTVLPLGEVSATLHWLPPGQVQRL